MNGYPVRLLNDTSNVTLANPLPVTLGSSNITISGDITIPTGVTVINPPNDPVNISAIPAGSNVIGDVGLRSDGVAVGEQHPLPVTVSSFAGPYNDAFGRLRISHPLTLYDSFHRYQDNGKSVEFTAGTASSAHEAYSSSIRLTIGGALGDRIYRESSRVFAYQPGKSLLILQTFAMAPAKAGLLQRHGYFDTANGVFIQLNGTALGFVRRSSVTGAVQETIALQADWNVDRLDGTGPSGIALDMTRSQIMFIDVEWLGVGSVRVGFVIDGAFRICHIFHHANRSSIATADTRYPYMTTACLPVRVELENVAATGSASEYRVICTTVISEGGYELRGRPRTVGNSLVSVPTNLPIGDQYYPVLALRLKATRLGAIVLPTQFHLFGASVSTYGWRIVTGATVTGGNSWISAGDDSCVEYKMDGTNVVTDGVVVKSGFFTTNAQSAPTIALEPGIFRYQLERNSFTSTAFTFVLAVAGKSNNDKVYASMDWEEVT